MSLTTIILNNKEVEVIDGIKVMQAPLSFEELKSNPLIDTHGFINLKTGEVKVHSNKFAKHRHINIGIIPIAHENGFRIQLDGSIHKFYRGENYSDFSFPKIKLAIDALCSSLQIDPEDTVLNNLEFSINIPLPYSTDRLFNSIISHKTNPFTNMPASIVKKGRGIEVGYEQYFLKIYDKGAQEDLNENLLRIEVKVVKMAFFKKRHINIRTLSDLMNKEIYLKLKDLFLNILSELLICDYSCYTIKGLSDSDQMIIANGRNPNFWQSLKDEYKKVGNTKIYSSQRRRFNSKMENFRKTIKKYGLDKIKDELIEISARKWDELINEEPDMLELNEFDIKTNPPSLKNKAALPKRTKSQPSVKSISYAKSEQNHTIDKSGNCSSNTNERKCLVTGADISDQKPGSKFVNAEKAGGELEAHRIRNAHSNPRNKLRERIIRQIPKQMILLNPNIYLKLTEKEIELLEFWRGTPYDILTELEKQGIYYRYD